jgi:hypothetical protein
MERSIDTARSRRVSTPGSPNGAASFANDAPLGYPTAPAAARSHNPAMSAPRHNNGNASPAAPSNASPMIGSSPLIGGGNGATGPGATNPTPGNDGQPPRLKARPKRFEGTFSAQFNPPAYRSQAG